jgi:hypothetical protein
MRGDAQPEENLCAITVCLSGNCSTDLLQKLSIDRDVALVTDGREQHQDSVAVFDVAFENPHKVRKWAIANDDLVTALQVFVELNEAIFADARFDQFDHFVFQRDWTITKTDDLTDSACEPNFAQHATRFKAGENVSGKQRSSEGSRAAAIWIYTPLSELRCKRFNTPGIQVFGSSLFL